MPSYIELTQGQTAIVDDEFVGELEKYRWFARKDHNQYYAQGKQRPTKKNGKYVQMHRLVLHLAGIEPGTHVDHRDRNGLNNQLENLRPATASTNAMNSRIARSTCGYKGVTFSRSTGRWQAQIGVNGKRFYLGIHDTPEAAARAYNSAAEVLHGEFACLNNI